MSLLLVSGNIAYPCPGPPKGDVHRELESFTSELGAAAERMGRRHARHMAQVQTGAGVSAVIDGGSGSRVMRYALATPATDARRVNSNAAWSARCRASVLMLRISSWIA